MTLADLSKLPPGPQHRRQDPELLHGELLEIIRGRIRANPRAQQKAIGLSEIGHPCDRFITHILLETPKVDTGDGWRPAVGTAVHSWLHDAFVEHNATLDTVRWLCEFKLPGGQVNGRDIYGSGDLYDRWTATYVDFKVVGPTTLRTARAGPDVQYRVQAQACGRGYVLRGLPVDTVANLYLPSNGALRESVFWHEPYDERVAVDAMARLERLDILAKTFGPKAAAAALTFEPKYGCTTCRFYLPAATDLTEACPGHVPTPAVRRGHDLIAREEATNVRVG